MNHFSVLLTTLHRRWMFQWLSVLLSVLVGYLTGIFLAKNLGPELYGTYNTLISFLILCSSMMSYGAYSSLIRYMPDYIKQNKWSYARGILLFFLKKWLRNSIFIVLIWILLFIFYKNNMFSHIIYWSCLALPFAGLSYFLIGLINTTRYINISNFIWGSLFPIQIVLWTCFLKKIINLEHNWSLILIYNLSSIGFCALILPFIYLAIPKIFIKGEKCYQYHQWLMHSRHFIVINTLTRALDHLPIIIMHLIFYSQNKKQVGLYACLILIGRSIGSYLPKGIGNIMAPIIHPLLEQKKTAELQIVIKQIISLRLSSTCVLMLLFLYYKNSLLGFFGDYFLQNAGPGFNRILLMTMIMAPFTYCFNFFKYSGYDEILARSLMILTPITLLLDFILIKHYGLQGAIICYLVNGLPLELISYYFIKKYFKIKPLILF